MEHSANGAIARTIENLNISYLHALREVASSSPAEAALRFGVSREVAKSVCDAPLESLHALANPSVMLFKPRLTPSGLNLALGEGGTVGRSRLFSQLLGE